MLGYSQEYPKNYLECKMVCFQTLHIIRMLFPIGHYLQCPNYDFHVSFPYWSILSRPNYNLHVSFLSIGYC